MHINCCQRQLCWSWPSSFGATTERTQRGRTWQQGWQCVLCWWPLLGTCQGHHPLHLIPSPLPPLPLSLNQRSRPWRCQPLDSRPISWGCMMHANLLPSISTRDLACRLMSSTSTIRYSAILVWFGRPRRAVRLFSSLSRIWHVQRTPLPSTLPWACHCQCCLLLPPRDQRLPCLPPP